MVGGGGGVAVGVWGGVFSLFLCGVFVFLHGVLGVLGVFQQFYAVFGVFGFLVQKLLLWLVFFYRELLGSCGSC